MTRSPSAIYSINSDGKKCLSCENGIELEFALFGDTTGCREVNDDDD